VFSGVTKITSLVTAESGLCVPTFCSLHTSGRYLKAAGIMIATPLLALFSIALIAVMKLAYFALVQILIKLDH
jgi:hypothetical protein